MASDNEFGSLSISNCESILVKIENESNPTDPLVIAGALGGSATFLAIILKSASSAKKGKSKTKKLKFKPKKQKQ